MTGPSILGDSLYRGRSPRSVREALWLRQQFGIDTIICLEKFNPRLERWCALAGIHLFRFPLSGVFPPRTADVAAILRFIAGLPDETTALLCCHAGADRTGVVSAAKRVVVDRWPIPQAIEEMYARGFHYVRFFWWWNAVESLLIELEKERSR